MLFNTFHFFIYFIVTAVLYWIVPGKTRWMVLVLASLVFYGANIPEYILVLVLSVLVNYYFGIIIGKSQNEKRRKSFLYLGLFVNILMLAFFKYANEIFELYAPLLSVFLNIVGDWVPVIDPGTTFRSIILPLGISFYTFTNIAYLIDVKRRTTEHETNLGYFTVFVTFFPKLILGPIERANAFLPQIKTPRIFDTNQAVDGLRLILWGFFKKLVVADRLGVAVDAVYADYTNTSGPVLVFIAILYSFQIYIDFSSYIDIARGTAKILGFNLSRNFNLPYKATSIKDFWDRWHITLSTWLRDYIFLPVAFKSSKILKKEKYFGIKTDHLIYAFAASTTFIIAGLWHGTGWNYLFWGALFAFYLIVANITGKTQRSFFRATGIIKRKKLYNTIQIFITFTLVTFAWIFFRSESLDGAFSYIAGIPKGWSIITNMPELLARISFPAFTTQDLVLVTISIVFIELLEYHFYHHKLLVMFRNPPRVIRWGFYYALLLMLFIFGKFESEGFIYFQF